MRLRFQWASHLWLEGARWRVSPGFDREVLAWLKRHYVALEVKRPPSRLLKQGTVILFYREKTDPFGAFMHRDFRGVYAAAVIIVPAESSQTIT